MDPPIGSRKPKIGSVAQATTSSAASADQHTFVVENLERRIRDSIKLTSTSSEESQTSMQSISGSLVPDPGVLASLEGYARTISASIDVLLRDLRGSLHGMGDLTVEGTECFHDAICASCDSVDATIKNTYALLAKVEELNGSMNAIRKLSQQVKDIKRIVDLFETQLLTGSVT